MDCARATSNVFALVWSHSATVSVQAVAAVADTITAIAAEEGTSEAVAVAAVAETVAAEVAASFQFTTFSVFRLLRFLGVLLSVAHGQHGDQQEHLIVEIVSLEPVPDRTDETRASYQCEARHGDVFWIAE